MSESVKGTVGGYEDGVRNAIYREHKQNAENRKLNKRMDKRFTWVFSGNKEEYFEPLAKLSAAVMIADGHPHPDEWSVCKDICTDLELDWSTFKSLMEKEIAGLRVLDKMKLGDYTLDITSQVNKKSKDLIFESILFVVLADGFLTIEECELLEIISSALEIPVSVMLARIAMLLRDEEEIVVDISEELLWRGSSYVAE